ncbi:MAG: two pore domain potassium channel family protein [Clostridia bacterium]|nr:two pore domain potassium channel family protein [Clostridia bacterium]
MKPKLKELKSKLVEWFSIKRAKNPRMIVLLFILLINIVFWSISAFLISRLALSGTEGMSFWEAAYYTVTMILDAGCIQFVIADIGASGVAIAIICMVIILLGMILFTGAVIGYVTNYISSYIDNANSGTSRLKVSGHLVILNWNTRASEIVNDLLYCPGKQVVVVLVDDRKAEIQKEVNERIAHTIAKENADLRKDLKGLGFLRSEYRFLKNRLKNNITLIVREGDVFSSKQLHDISLERSRSVVILGSDINNSVCRFENLDRIKAASRGNAQTVKTLMQVSDITAAEYSDDNQKIIVEITDDWTHDLVERIIRYKVGDTDESEQRNKCNIVPVRVNQILGQILSQFSLMPELNYAYSELFSNKGATFCVKDFQCENDVEYISSYLETHPNALPLTSMAARKDGTRQGHFYYSAEDQRDIDTRATVADTGYRVKLNHRFHMSSKNVVILGHNSNCKYIMEGFASFVGEWQSNDPNMEVLNILVIDDAESLEKHGHYREYPFVFETVAATIYDRELICSTIERFVDSNENDTSVLILSDDNAPNDEIDSNALANLVYVQDIINSRKQNDAFDPESIDIIIEIIDPKHHDVIRSYNISNIVISNRYISKMITQIGEKEAIFDFYTDILTYDVARTAGYESKEVYAKKVGDFFEELPDECTVSELVRAVWYASIDSELPQDMVFPTMVLGCVKPGGKVMLFGAHNMRDMIKLEAQDKLIVYSTH